MKSDTKKPAPKGRRFSRLRRGYREHADRKNPRPSATVYDAFGRPREPKGSHHAWIGQCRP